MTKQQKILYVDDEPINTELFKINFSDNFDVITASDGKEGLEMLEKNIDTEAIISDMKMPGMNGIEFINSARQKYPDKKYYILSGYDITKEIQEAIKKGIVEHYFKKPFNMSEIENTLKRQTDN